MARVVVRIFAPLALLTAGALAAPTPADAPYTVTRKRLISREQAPCRFGAPQFSPDGKYLLFSDIPKGGDGPGALWIAGGDGSGPRLLVRGAHDVQWSPHGKRVTFLDGDGALWSVRPDGTGRVLLASGVVTDRTPAYRWSPTGDQLAYLTGAKKAESSSGLWVMNAAGGGKRRLMAGDLEFEWAPDGRHLCVWEHHQDPTYAGARASYLISGATGKFQRAAAPPGHAATGQVAVAPGGKHLALVCYGPEVDGTEPDERTPRAHVFLQELQAGRWQRLCSLTATECTLHWSPKGDRLAVYNTWDMGGEGRWGDFALYRANGERIAGDRPGAMLTWSPAGGRLAFFGGEGESNRPMACDNAGLRRTTLRPFSDLYPTASISWTPDGMSVAVVVCEGENNPVGIDLVTLTVPAADTKVPKENPLSQPK